MLHHTNLYSTNCSKASQVRPQKSLELAQFANDKLANLLEGRDDLLVGNKQQNPDKEAKAYLIDGKVAFGPVKPDWMLEGKPNPHERKRIRAGVYADNRQNPGTKSVQESKEALKPKDIKGKSITKPTSPSIEPPLEAKNPSTVPPPTPKSDTQDSDTDTDISTPDTDSTVSQAPDDVPYNPDQPAIATSELLELEIIANDLDNESDFDGGEEYIYDDEADEHDEDDDYEDESEEEDEYGRTRGTLFPMSMATRIQEELDRVRAQNNSDASASDVMEREFKEEISEQHSTKKEKKMVHFNEVISVKRFEKNPPKKKPAHASGMISTNTRFEPLNDVHTEESPEPPTKTSRFKMERLESKQSTPSKPAIAATPNFPKHLSKSEVPFSDIVFERDPEPITPQTTKASPADDESKPAKVSRFKMDRAGAAGSKKPHIPDPSSTAAPALKKEVQERDLELPSEPESKPARVSRFKMDRAGASIPKKPLIPDPSLFGSTSAATSVKKDHEEHNSPMGFTVVEREPEPIAPMKINTPNPTPKSRFQPKPPKPRGPVNSNVRAAPVPAKEVKQVVADPPAPATTKTSRFKSQINSKKPPQKFPVSSRIEELESYHKPKPEAPKVEKPAAATNGASKENPAEKEDEDDRGSIFNKYQEASGTVINPALINGLRSIIPAEVLKRANEYYENSLMTEDDFIKAHLGDGTKDTKDGEEQKNEEDEKEKQQREEEEKKRKELAARPVLADALVEREVAPEVDSRGMGFLPDHKIGKHSQRSLHDDEENDEATDSDEEDYSISRRELMDEYQKVRQSLIYSTGGYGKSPEELETDTVEEETGRKVSRFKMARLSTRRA